MVSEPVDSGGASAMIRLAGSRVPLTKANLANQLIAVAAARPSATRPVNPLLYSRGLALCQSMAELEILEALPRQNAANVFLTPQLTG